MERAPATQSMIDRKIIQETFFLPVEGAIFFDCYFCTELFKHKEELVKHIAETHHATLCEPLVLCVDAKFLSPQDKHRKIPGSSAKKNKKEGDVSNCKVCGQTFPDSSDLETHMKKHKDSFIYSCNICGRRYKEPRFLKIHRKTHFSRSGGKNENLPICETPITINGVVQEQGTKNVTSPYKQCMDCGVFCLDNEALLDHRKHHIKGSKLAQNSTYSEPSIENVQGSNGKQITKEQFLGLLNLRPATAPVQKPAAKRKCLAELDPIITCQAWQLATTGKLDPGKGKKQDTIAENKSVKCKKFANVEETESIKSEDGASPIQDMDENKSPNNQKSYVCADCRKLFKTYHQLVLHSRVHRKKSSDSASYNGHFMMASPHTPSVPVDNEEIKMEVVSESEEAAGNSIPTERKHEEIVQSKGLPVSTQCCYCKKSFGSSYYLNIHLRTHTGEKPYKCDLCDYSAAQKTSLRYHLEKHHGYKPGDSHEKVKSISKSLELSRKALEEPLPNNKTSPLSLNGDKVEFLSSRLPKRMSALRNKLVSARHEQNKEPAALQKKEDGKVKAEDVGALISYQPPNNPSPTLESEEEISWTYAVNLDDEPRFMEEDFPVGENNSPSRDNEVETTPEENINPTDDLEPLDLSCPSSSNRRTNMGPYIFPSMHQCPQCTFTTLNIEVLYIHQRLYHRESYQLFSNLLCTDLL